MTPEQRERYLAEPTNGHYHHGPPVQVSVRTSLTLMCISGATAVKLGQYDMLDFDLMNVAEAEFVKAYMDEHYPGVPYRRRWFEFTPKGDTHG